MCRDHSPLAATGAAPELPVDTVATVLRERRGSGLAEVIPSTRGEPLLWPGMERLVELCAAEGVQLNLTTNGTFPRGGARDWAARLEGVASDVKVSWNGATASTAEAIMAGLSFDEAVENVRALVAAREAARARGKRAFTVSFQVTAQERNVGELPEIVRLAARLGVDRVKLNQLQVHFAALAGEDLRRDAASRARWNAAVRAARGAAERAPRVGGGRVVLQNSVELGDAPVAPGRCPFLGVEAWILSDGRFAPCPAPAAERGELGAFGSVGDRTLGEVWRSAPYLELLRGYERRPTCAGCPFRRPGGA
jgi:MoaA/NifB/PqqE/SkfB family radical SAM enzyme